MTKLNTVPPQGGEAHPTTSPKRDELDLGRYRIDQDVEEFAGGKKLLTTVPVRKPSKEHWIRTHPEKEFWFSARVIELKESGEFYLVEPEIRDVLLDRNEKCLVRKLLILSQNKQGDNFVWPIRIPAADESLDDWSKSSLEAADLAKRKWIRIVSNKSLSAYEIIQREGVSPEPKWPELSMGEIMKIAFKDKIIGDLDHPVLCDLLGRESKKKDVIADIVTKYFSNNAQPAGAQ
jgi:hypothetical protein